MKKKVLSVLLSTAMVTSLLVGCGSKEATEAPAAEEPAAEEEAEAEEPAAEEEAEAPAEEEAAVEVPEDTGKVLNIYC